MRVKENNIRRSPTQEEIEHLTYPKDKFELLSVDFVDEWDSHKTDTSKDNPNHKDHVYKRKSVYITVKCKKCGSVKHEVVDSQDLSCKIGPCMPTWVDLTGQRFGSLFVEGLSFEKTKRTKRHYVWYWKCKCNCGRTCFKKAADLVSHYQRMCPVCARKEAVRKTTLPGQKSKWNRMIRVYRKNALALGREFLLTDDQFVSISKEKCHYCGADPIENAYGVVSNGLDRVNSSIGYSIDNVVPCCKICNVMKNKLSVDDFLKHISSIYKHSILTTKLNDHPEMEYASSEAEMGISL
jgi:hypothetical protein